MNQEYSLGGDVINVGGGGLNDLVKNSIGAHYNIALGLIILLIIAIVYLLFFKEGFSPSTTARAQVVSLSGGEAMGDRSQSAFAQMVQSEGLPVPAQWYQPAPQAMVMSDDASAYCADAGKPNDDAWSWMGMVARSNGGDAANYGTNVYGQESMKGGKNLVAVMNGY